MFVKMTRVAMAGFVVVTCTLVCAVVASLAINGPGSRMIDQETHSLLSVDYGPDEEPRFLALLDEGVVGAARLDYGNTHANPQAAFDNSGLGVVSAIAVGPGDEPIDFQPANKQVIALAPMLVNPIYGWSAVAAAMSTPAPLLADATITPLRTPTPASVDATFSAWASTPWPTGAAPTPSVAPAQQPVLTPMPVPTVAPRLPPLAIPTFPPPPGS